MNIKKAVNSGFTLIELSIVIVIIGLIVGGIMAGKTIIDSAAIRSQISQINQYTTAVNTFKLKYNALPGDISNPSVSSLGFSPRGVLAGQGDNNGIIQSYHSGGVSNVRQGGEIVLFWTDLSSSGLIPNTLNGTVTQNFISTTADATHPISNFLPLAKIGDGNYVSVFSRNANGFFNIASFNCSTCQVSSDGGIYTVEGMSVQQAYNIDSKIDDGLPQSGVVTAELSGIYWAGDFRGWYGGTGLGGQNTSWFAASTRTCFDNGGVGGRVHKYTLAVGGGANINCALAFKFN